MDWRRLEEEVIIEGMCVSAQREIDAAVAGGTLTESSEEWDAHLTLIELVRSRCERTDSVMGSLTSHDGWTTQYEDWDVDSKDCEHIAIYYKKVRIYIY